MLLEWVDYYSLIFLAPFLALEFFWRARRYDAPRGWRWRAAAVSLAVFGVSLAVGRAWGAVLPSWSLVDGAALGTWGGALAGILVYEFLHYWYHRFAHQWNWLWRLGHQMHHSAESVDAFGAYYLHPLDAALFTTWAVIAFYLCSGSRPRPGPSRGPSWRSMPHSSTRTSARRTGSATSCSGPRAMASTTAAASTAGTTPTCPSGTWFSAPSPSGKWPNLILRRHFLQIP